MAVKISAAQQAKKAKGVRQKFQAAKTDMIADNRSLLRRDRFKPKLQISFRKARRRRSTSRRRAR